LTLILLIISLPADAQASLAGVRDSSLVFKALIDQYTLGLDKTLRQQIDNFIAAEKVLQQTS
jgi:hypothetical protein